MAGRQRRHGWAAALIEKVSHRADGCTALPEYLSHFWIDGEVYIPLAVALASVREGVMDFTVGIGLHNRKGPE
jgi:hypothetical protein